jgi:hypothetical protein
VIPDIQKQFIAANKHRLQHITFVGGEYEPGKKVLCENDKYTLRGFVYEMNKLKIPLSVDIALAADERHDLSPESYRIVNIDSRHGDGQGFEAFRDKAEIVLFCNIPLGNEARPGPDEKDLPAWKEALEKSGARIAWINGSDSFPPESMQGDTYITVRPDTDRYSYLIVKSYFKSMYDHLEYTESPMMSMIEPYESTGATSFHARPKRGLQTPEDWNKYIISPRLEPSF